MSREEKILAMIPSHVLRSAGAAARRLEQGDSDEGDLQMIDDYYRAYAEAARKL